MSPLEHMSYCRFCVAQCGIRVEVDGADVLRVRGDIDHPLSKGYTCAKGRSLPKFHTDPRRLDTPQIGRPPHRSDATWDAVVKDLAARIQHLLDTDGPDSVGLFLGTGAGHDTAGGAVGSRLAAALRTKSIYTPLTIDGPSKPLVGTLVGGHPGLFAASIDYERTTMTLIVGSNPMVSHGHSTAMPNPSVRLRGLTAQGEVWVADPRVTETAVMATRHLAPRPGTDHIWLAAMVREMLQRVDRAELATRAHGVEELADAVRPFDLATAASRCGLSVTDLEALRDALLRHGRFSGITGTGVSMSRNANLAQWLMLVLLVITDSADQPGGTWFNPGFHRSLDRKPWRPGPHRTSAGPPSRPELPTQFGERPSAALADEIAAGNIRALLVLGANLVTCLPNTRATVEALSRIDTLAVVDVVDNDTTRLATHVLPAAGQLERADMTYAAEQYLPEVAAQYTAAIVPPAAERRPLWWILARLAEKLGLDVLPGGLRSHDCTTDDILADLMTTSRTDFPTLREQRRMVAEDAVFGWVNAGVTDRGGWDLAPADLVADLRDATDPPPLVLNPRRQLRHLNSQLVETPGLPTVQDAPDVLVHPHDARNAGLRDGDRVQVMSAHGSLNGTARIDDAAGPGTVSIPHGFGATNVNDLTSGHDGVDRLSGMPLYSGLPLLLVRLGSERP